MKEKRTANKGMNTPVAQKNPFCKTCFFHSSKTHSCDYCYFTGKPRRYSVKKCKCYIPNELIGQHEGFVRKGERVKLIKSRSGRIFNITPCIKGNYPEELINGVFKPLNYRLSIKYLKGSRKMTAEEYAELRNSGLII